MERQYYVIDAFTSRRFAGNPAAVVLDADGLDEGRLQAIASEFNLSETTFILPPVTAEAFVRFRWFTPTVEVAMCGHATIGGVLAMVESGRLQCPEPGEGTQIGIDTLSGTLTAFVEQIPGSETDLMIWLEMPEPGLVQRDYDAAELAAVLSLPTDALDAALPMMETQDKALIVMVQDVTALNEARPDLRRLSALQTRNGTYGLCLATVRTLTPVVHVQSRFFAPALGIDEDPVTGSVHGPLAAYLVMQGLVPVEGGMAGLTCVQGRPGGRAGLVHALVQRGPDTTCSVRIGGQAVAAMRGTLLA
jgi:PhzF family phenazine biosynthesis protein